VKAQEGDAIVDMGDVRRLDRPFKSPLVLQEALDLVPQPLRLRFAAMGEQQPVVRIAHEGTVAQVRTPAALLDRPVQAIIVRPPVVVELVQVPVGPPG
jgi:hypothetical protein